MHRRGPALYTAGKRMRYPKRKLALFFTAQTLAIAVMGFLPGRTAHGPARRSIAARGRRLRL